MLFANYFLKLIPLTIEFLLICNKVKSEFVILRVNNYSNNIENIPSNHSHRNLDIRYLRLTFHSTFRLIERSTVAGRIDSRNTSWKRGVKTSPHNRDKFIDNVWPRRASSLRNNQLPQDH